MNKVKAWRKARSLTQEQAAELLAMTARHYQRIEAGHRPVTPMVERIMQLI
jgi:transcriptional regulator with XRE-family HTH domain